MRIDKHSAGGDNARQRGVTGMSASPDPPTLILPDDPGESEIQRLDRKIEQFLVVLITIIGAILRCLWLNRPTLSVPEANLYDAVSGSFASLHGVLHGSHASALYLISYWGIARVVPLNPWVMRLIPAIAGTCMIPAIYFLARQIVSPRAAILAAALTACSGYLLGWSRQAQVEMPFWLFVVLSFGMLLYWLRSRRALAYFAWLTSGIIMLALKPAGATALALEVLVFVTFFPQRPPEVLRRKPRLRQLGSLIALVILFVGGVIIIAAPQLYAQRVGPRIATTQSSSAHPATAPSATAFGWQGQIGDGATGAELSLASFSTILMGWQYPMGSERSAINGRALWYLAVALEVLTILLVLGLAPWRREKLAAVRPRPMERVELPKLPMRWREPSGFERFAQSPWRLLLWLLVWLLAPGYLFYCAAAANAGSPFDLNAAILDTMARRWMYACIVLAAVAGSIVFWIRGNHPISRADIRRDVVPVIQLVLILAGIWGVGVAIQRVARGGGIPLELLPDHAGFLFAPFAILVATLLYRIRWNRLRRLGIFLLLAINVAFAAFFVLKDPRPRVDLMARDVLAANAPRSVVRTFFYAPAHEEMDTGTIFNAVGEYYQAIESGVPPRQASADGRGIPESRWKIERIANERMAAFRAARGHRADLLILWDRAGEPTPMRNGSITESGQWTLAEENAFPVYDPWTWRHLYTLRRRVFSRSASRER
jgi:4-amino-4-deoxy-L-arabinose transferase-like glycosyltransferase